ncbi:hypothetical protein EC991_006794 [Linnemannia zychae]|nr:hypothetical protein EC991_006794 [Linnemannia zychae]
MPIIRTFPLLHTFKRPILDTTSHQQPSQTEDAAERGHAVIEDLGDYPSELLQLRLQAVQDHLSKHHPSTAIYVASLGAVLAITITLIATCLALHVSDGKPWVLGVIVIMILVFISKMAFLSRIERDMPHYGVLFRLRPRNYTSQLTASGRSEWPVRLAYRLNLGLPCWALDLTTIDHIDEYSFQDHPASDPHASPEEILARENELPTYRPKAEQDGDNNVLNHRVLGEALPPQYTDIVELQQTNSSAGSSHPDQITTTAAVESIAGSSQRI